MKISGRVPGSAPIGGGGADTFGGRRARTCSARAPLVAAALGAVLTHHTAMRTARPGPVAAEALTETVADWSRLMALGENPQRC